MARVYDTTTSTVIGAPVDTEIYLDEYNESDIGNGLEEYSDMDSFTINSNASYNSRGWAAVTNNLTGIFGLPYQWSPEVDPVLEYTGTDPSSNSAGRVGRKFSEKILSVMPILFLTPGEPKFMGNSASANARESMAANIMDKLLGGGDEGFEEDEGRYYSFYPDYENYKRYANVALRAVLFYMGLSDSYIPVPGSERRVRGSSFNIDAFMNNDFTKLFGDFQTLPFYLDAETSINEDFSNSSTESMLAQTANGFSSTARELQFILGNDDAGGLAKNLQSVSTDLVSNLGSAFGDLSEAFAGKNMISNVLGEVTTIVQGGKIIFPEIWSDSSYSKSYSINMKFRSPDPDPISIFLNVYMPILLLVTLASPKQLNNNSNAYESPCIVRASYKSIFNVDMGLIESLSITRGGEDKWNILGMPYTADVSITIKDLYSTMFVSAGMGLLNNTAQMDYLATMAGVDLNSYEPTRIIRLGAMILADEVIDLPSRAWGGIKQGLNRKIGSVLSRFSDTRSLGL